MSAFKQLVLGLVVVAIAIAVWANYVPSARLWLEKAGLMAAEGPTGQSGSAGSNRPSGGGVAQVVAVPVVEGVLNDRIVAIGDGRAVRSVTVRSEATGRVDRIDFDAGSYVERGAVIFGLDDEAERIAVERANLALLDSREEMSRLLPLHNTGAISDVRFSDAELALRTAELQLQEAEFVLKQRVVRAPISGWIGLLEVEQGDRVSAQDALAMITDRSQILIDFRVPERVISLIETGMPLTASPLAFPDMALQGEISAIDNIVERASRTLRVQGLLQNDNDRLRAGMAFSVNLAFEGEVFPSVDPLALQWSSEGSYVWAVRNGKVEQVAVAIRQRNSDSVLVEAKLDIGELVVVEGVMTLRPGAEVSLGVEGAAQVSSEEPVEEPRDL